MRPRDLDLAPRAKFSSVVAGDARIVGSRTSAGRDALGIPPGVISPYEVRLAMGLRYGDPAVEEARYERTRTPLSDLATAARFAVLSLAAVPSPTTPSRVDVLGVKLDALDTGAVIDRVIAWLEATSGAVVYFVHPHALNLAQHDDSLRGALSRADLVLPDGAGIRLAASLLDQRLPANVNGTDLVPELLLELSAAKLPIALVGGAPGVAEQAAAAWARRFGVTVRATHHGFDDEAGFDRFAASLEASGPCLVLVGLGSPLQERFVARHLEGRRGLVAMTVGGLFDFASDQKPRAPLAIRELGLEWAFRLAVEPRRLAHRYLVGNPLFVARVLGQRLRRDGMAT